MKATRWISEYAGGLRGKVLLPAIAAAATWTLPWFLAVARAEANASPPDAPSQWLEWILVIAFLGLCCGIAFKDPKRSHQD